MARPFHEPFLCVCISGSGPRKPFQSWALKLHESRRDLLAQPVMWNHLLGRSWSPPLLWASSSLKGVYMGYHRCVWALSRSPVTCVAGRGASSGVCNSGRVSELPKCKTVAPTCLILQAPCRPACRCLTWVVHGVKSIASRLQLGPILLLCSNPVPTPTPRALSSAHH